jgi:hypothetical protein
VWSNIGEGSRKPNDRTDAVTVEMVWANERGPASVPDNAWLVMLSPRFARLCAFPDLSSPNDGAASSDESPIEITDTPPANVTASSISGEDLGNGRTLLCALTPAPHCAYQSFAVAPGDVLVVRIAVRVKANVVSPAVNEASVSGGGATEGASVTYPTTIDSGAAPFGVSGFAIGASNTQAGAHPNVSFGFDADQKLTSGEAVPVSAVKDFSVRLPAGLLATPTATPECSAAQVASSSCPADTAVGVVFATMSPAAPGPPAVYSSLVYNTAP